MTVYSTLYDGLQGGVESIKAPTRIQPRTPLWFLFDSELDLIANHAFPTEASILQRNPQNTLVEKLGEHAGYMLELWRIYYTNSYPSVLVILIQLQVSMKQPCATICQQNYFIVSITLKGA